MGRGRHHSWRVLAAGLAVTAGALTGCSSAPPAPDHANLTVDATTSLADQPVHLAVSGLQAGETVTVSARSTDQDGNAWQSSADFRADTQGRVSLDTAKPLSGSYQGADGMGLFWSMDPKTGPSADQTVFRPVAGPSFDVTVTVTAAGQQLATRTLTRSWSAPDITTRALTMASDHVAGELFLPPAGTTRHTAVLLFGGSEGGNHVVKPAAELASRGYPVLALGYFAMPGTPAHLVDIPLEYFATAARLLAAQPGVDPAHVLAIGYSRGSEAALLLADRYPDLIHGAVVFAPSAVVNGGYPNGQGAAWTQGGRPVPRGTIALDRVNGPLLALAGEQDAVWQSYQWAPEIDQALTQAGDRFPHHYVIYPGAGHELGLFPYLPEGTDVGGENAGGTRAGDESAEVASWSALLGFLRADHS